MHQTSENIEAVGAPHIRARTSYAFALELSDRALKAFHYYLYKFAIAQKLFKSYFNSRRKTCRAGPESVPKDAIFCGAFCMPIVKESHKTCFTAYCLNI